MITRVYGEPHQVRSPCGRDPYVAKHSGRGLPRYMTGVMDDLAYNSGGGGPVPNPATNVRRNSITIPPAGSLIMDWDLPVAGPALTAVKVFLTTTNVAPAPSGTGTSLGPTATTNTFSGLTDNTTYYGWVYTQNANGYSTVATTGALLNWLPGPPEQPLQIKTVTYNSITITWSPPISGGGPIGYIALYNTTGTPPTDPINDPNAQEIAFGSEFAIFTGLTASTLYYLYVYSYSLSGYSSPLTASIQTPAQGITPGDPTGISITGVTVNDMTINWTNGANAEHTYIWQFPLTDPGPPAVSDPPTSMVPVPIQTEAYGLLAPGTIYYYYLASVIYTLPTYTFSAVVGPVSATTSQ